MSEQKGLSWSPEAELATAKDELATAKDELVTANDKLATAYERLDRVEKQGSELAQMGVRVAIKGVDLAQTGVDLAQTGVRAALERVKSCQEVLARARVRAFSLPRNISRMDRLDLSQDNATSATLEAMNFLTTYFMSTGDVTVRGVALQDIIGDTLGTKSFEKALELSADEGFSQEPLIDFTTLSNSETAFQNQVLNPFLQKQGIIHTDPDVKPVRRGARACVQDCQVSGCG
jgi:hypothetical protein